MEFFSPPRVAVELRRYGLRAQYSFDIQTGYDFTTFEDRARAMRLVGTHCPFFTMLSPPCTMYSPLQNLNLGKMDPQVKKKRFEEAHCLLDFSMIIAIIESLTADSSATNIRKEPRAGNDKLFKG